jgi:hypothetical protein
MDAAAAQSAGTAESAEWHAFGYTADRRSERELIAWYERQIDAIIEKLNVKNVPDPLSIARAARDPRLLPGERGCDPQGQGRGSAALRAPRVKHAESGSNGEAAILRGRDPCNDGGDDDSHHDVEDQRAETDIEGVSGSAQAQGRNRL